MASEKDVIKRFGLEPPPNGFYYARTECTNCRDRQAVFIRKGKRVRDVQGLLCDNCGCSEFLVMA
jgi:ribosomal protein S27E